MIRTYSIAEARNHLAEIIHDLEQTPHVEVTRRGRPVAVLLSIQAFERLRSGGVGFWDAYQAFRDTVNPADLDIEPGIFTGLRDESSGREVSL